MSPAVRINSIKAEEEDDFLAALVFQGWGSAARRRWGE